MLDVGFAPVYMPSEVLSRLTAGSMVLRPIALVAHETTWAYLLPNQAQLPYDRVLPKPHLQLRKKLPEKEKINPPRSLFWVRDGCGTETPDNNMSRRIDVGLICSNDEVK